MNTSTKDKKGIRVSIQVKTSGIAVVFVLLTVIALAIFSVTSMQDISLRTALLMGKEKIKGDIETFKLMVTQEYGELHFQNGELIDQQGNSLKYQYEIVDKVSATLNIVATVFIKEKDDYRRITTSIKGADGKRAVDTFLDSKGAAYSSVQSGKEYIGNAVVLGKNYLAAYYPLFQSNTAEVIGILFIGIEMSSIENTISQESSDEIKEIGIMGHAAF